LGPARNWLSDSRPWIFLMCALVAYLLMRLGVGPTRLLYIAFGISALLSAWVGL
jgi:hypothetical protein